MKFGDYILKETYNSASETQKHIDNVIRKVNEFSEAMISQSSKHDLSKLEDPEKKIFDEFTPKLKDSTYGSDEYNSFLVNMKPALDHHYANNRHHPEHFKNGLDGMDIIDLVEMMCDWKAATERHENGDIFKSLELNKKRFNMSEQTYNILYNTAKRMWDK
jgi:TFIIF-interacting CTD phosphatase-like protein